MRLLTFWLHVLLSDLLLDCKKPHDEVHHYHTNRDARNREVASFFVQDAAKDRSEQFTNRDNTEDRSDRLS